jgi:hypothetical protein
VETLAPSIIDHWLLDMGTRGEKDQVAPFVASDWEPFPSALPVSPQLRARASVSSPQTFIFIYKNGPTENLIIDRLHPRIPHLFQHSLSPARSDLDQLRSDFEFLLWSRTATLGHDIHRLICTYSPPLHQLMRVSLRQQLHSCSAAKIKFYGPTPFFFCEEQVRSAFGMAQRCAHSDTISLVVFVLSEGL